MKVLKNWKTNSSIKMEKSVFEVYKDASIKFSWTKELLKECKKIK